jgi:stearoyl-CoA desaturase (delta-9 desaturase)
MFWFTTRKAFQTDKALVKDWVAYPELRFLDRFDFLAPALLAAIMFAIGVGLEHRMPGLGVTGPQLLVWGFLISTITLYHVTYAINSIAHQVGTQRFATNDDNRNNFALAMITFGEGWHNNHHHYPASARQGFYWWEIDITYYILVGLSWLGVVWDLRAVPERILAKKRVA